VQLVTAAAASGNEPCSMCIFWELYKLQENLDQGVWFTYQCVLIAAVNSNGLAWLGLAFATLHKIELASK
jgi:hypothetical protein